MIGASIRPTPRPSKANPTYVISSDCAEYKSSQAMMCGMLTRNIALRLPSGSVNIPEKRHPIG